MKLAEMIIRTEFLVFAHKSTEVTDFHPCIKRSKNSQPFALVKALESRKKMVVHEAVQKLSINKALVLVSSQHSSDHLILSCDVLHFLVFIEGYSELWNHRKKTPQDAKQEQLQRESQQPRIQSQTKPKFLQRWNGLQEIALLCFNNASCHARGNLFKNDTWRTCQDACYGWYIGMLLRAFSSGCCIRPSPWW